jgi:hypothetical protein
VKEVSEGFQVSDKLARSMRVFEGLYPDRHLFVEALSEFLRYEHLYNIKDDEEVK